MNNSEFLSSTKHYISEALKITLLAWLLHQSWNINNNLEQIKNKVEKIITSDKKNSWKSNGK